MTNGDIIRDMTDFEIANEILTIPDKTYACEHCSRRYAICYKNVNCRKHILEWLKQEAQNE